MSLIDFYEQPSGPPPESDPFITTASFAEECRQFAIRDTRFADYRRLQTAAALDWEDDNGTSIAVKFSARHSYESGIYLGHAYGFKLEADCSGQLIPEELLRIAAEDDKADMLPAADYVRGVTMLYSARYVLAATGLFGWEIEQRYSIAHEQPDLNPEIDLPENSGDPEKDVYKQIRLTIPLSRRDSEWDLSGPTRPELPSDQVEMECDDLVQGMHLDSAKTIFEILRQGHADDFDLSAIMPAELLPPELAD
jgi:hypothetical protein